MNIKVEFFQITMVNLKLQVPFQREQLPPSSRYIYQTTWCHILEDRRLDPHDHKNFQSHTTVNPSHAIKY
jgi:hypothetical protein